MRYQVGNGLGGDVFDNGERGKEKNGGGFGALGVVDVGGWNGHIRCGEHESLSAHYQSSFSDANGKTYPIRRFNSTLLHRFHHTALFICNIPHPICPPSRNDHMRRPSLHKAVQLLVFVNAPFRRIFHLTGFAVMIAIFPVHSRVDFGEEGSLSGGRKSVTKV